MKKYNPNKIITMSRYIVLEDVTVGQARNMNRKSKKMDFEMVTDYMIPTLYRDFASWPKTTKIKCWNCSDKIPKIPVFIATPRIATRHIPHGQLLLDKSHDDIEYVPTEYEVEGMFCSFGCVQYYIKATNRPELQELIVMLWNMFKENGVNMPFGEPKAPVQKAKLCKHCYLSLDKNPVIIGNNKYCTKNCAVALEPNEVYAKYKYALIPIAHSKLRMQQYGGDMTTVEYRESLRLLTENIFQTYL